LNIAIMDVMTHAADIAKATGQSIDDEEILTVALDVGRNLVSDDFRQPGIFDAEQPADPSASASDKLLAFAGRKVSPVLAVVGIAICRPRPPVADEPNPKRQVEMIAALAAATQERLAPVWVAYREVLTLDS